MSFQQGVRNFNQRPGIFVNCKGIQNSFSFDSTPGQNLRSSAHDKNASIDNGKQNQGIVIKMAPQNGRKYLRGIPQLYVLVKKDWGNHPVINIKSLNDFIPYSGADLGPI